MSTPAAPYGRYDRALRTARHVRLISRFPDALNNVRDFLLGRLFRHIDNHLVSSLLMHLFRPPKK
jgi:hypothetical protein